MNISHVILYAIVPIIVVMLAGYISVSYTHLDVYKRQAYV